MFMILNVQNIKMCKLFMIQFVLFMLEHYQELKNLS